MTTWNVAEARQRYAVAHWGEGYFDVDEQGRLCAQPRGADGPRLAIDELVADAQTQGARLPLLLRFADILHHRRARLQSAFAQVMADWDYTGGYTAVFPIKTNQQRGVAGELASQGGPGFGLEAGSKPELMAVLALAKPGSIVICNGYKDREYIRLALIGRRLGLEIFIVVEKPSELHTVIAEARSLGVEPLLGVRMRLATIGAGKWQNTGGDKAKFGLSPRQVLDLVEQLKAAKLEHTLKLLHFHMGSQLSNVRDIAGGMREATRYFVELSKMGLPIRYMDVGGGLGVDYEGTRSRSFCSINYGLEQYAATIVQPLAEAAFEHGLKTPHVITEAGRAMTAHHAVLVVNVSEVEKAPEGAIPTGRADEPAVLRHLRELHEDLATRPPLEIYHEAQHHWHEGQTLYALGQLALADRARLDDLYYAIAHAVRGRLKFGERAHRQVIDELDLKLVDKYFVNFSLFESIPDVWAIDQVFPIVPLTRLEEEPTRRGVIADLTCDSDGRIDQYVEEDGLDVSLPLHELQEGERYRLGIFMVGAYQETLGDIHNLFGDTDAATARVLDDGSVALEQFKRGDSCDVMLDYVGYDLSKLREAYREKIVAAGVDDGTAKQFESELETGLTGYTYLAE